MDIQLLVISGSMGAGKTTVLGEASDILAARGIVHAAIDLDWLGAAYLGPKTRDALTFDNLESVWRNYAAIDVKRLLLAWAVENATALDQLRESIPHAHVTVCRLQTSLATMQQRIRLREPGMHQEQYVARVSELAALLDQSRVEDFILVNEGRSVTDVARELLSRAGWLEEAPNAATS